MRRRAGATARRESHGTRGDTRAFSSLPTRPRFPATASRAASFWAHSRAILPRAPRQENLLRREAPSVLGPPQAPKNLASETLGAFLHGKSGVPKDISRTTTSRTTARNIPMPHPGAYVASDRETCVCAFKAFHASTCHSTAGISQNYDSLTDISQTTSASGGQPPPCSRTPGPGVTPCRFLKVRGPARP